ncbi:MAG TPA: FG-GAP-like repeat-containing protein [Polyangiaceae bacterium]
MDGDGFDELLIIDSSYPGTLDRLDSYQTQGIAYLFYGRAAVPATLSAAEADAMLVGVGPAVAKIGDISGDGYDDFAFTALCEFWPNCPATNGVHIAYGSAARLAGEHRSDEVGTTWSTGRNDSRYTWINGAGDVNGDGLSDFVVDVGTLNVGPEPWYTYLFLGRPNSAEQVAAGPAAVFEGMSGGHQVYAGSTGAGDVDGDGYDDLLISTLDWAEQTGTINLFYGGADRFEGSVLPGEADASFAWLSDAFGIGGFGDLDGDGFDDLFLTAQLSVGWRPVHVIYGREERFSGSYGLDAVEFSIEGSTNMSGLGAGDVNGDGALDVLLGDVDAYLDYGWGALFLQLGSGTRREGTLALTLDNVLLRGQTRDRRGDHMGSGVAANGDFNADGYDDVVVCAWGDDGRVFLILGKSL